MNVFDALHRFKRITGLTYEQIAKATGWSPSAPRGGVSFHKVKAHYEGRNKPNFEDGLSYVRVFGPEFLNVITAPIGIGGAHKVMPLEGCIFIATLGVVERVTDVGHQFSQFTADGRIDHIENPVIPVLISDLCTDIMPVAIGARTGTLQ